MAGGASEASQLTLRQVAALPFAQRLHHREYRRWVRFAVFGQAVPAALFAFVGWLQYGHLLQAMAAAAARPSLQEALTGLIPRTLYLVFCCMPVVLYLTRPMPQARDGRFIARAAAFTGTLMLLVVGALFPTHGTMLPFPSWSRDLAPPLSILAFSMGILSMSYLRRNLSIIPEARRLVVTGPYRFARHPLYFAEICAATALLLAAPYRTPAIALVIFIVMQNIRASFEERLLRATFPEYADYARRTRRIVPFVW